jgi:acyl-CoA thioesterase YciA
MWPYTADEADALSAGRPPPAPRGELASRVLAMPADTNPAGNVFGGWIMALMDSAGAMAAMQYTPGRVATVAVTDMTFHAPVRVGDTVCCYAELARLGRTSLSFHIEVWVLRDGKAPRTKVTEAEFTFVAVDENGLPQPIAGRDANGRPSTPGDSGLRAEQ